MSSQNPRDSHARETGNAEGVLERWLRRRQRVHSPAGATPVESESDVPRTMDEAARVLPTDADMPALETLTEESDFSAFLSPGVSEELRRLALRKLFGMPNYNLRDGLDDYDDDYTGMQTLRNAIARGLLQQSPGSCSRSTAPENSAMQEPVPADGAQAKGQDELAADVADPVATGIDRPQPGAAGKSTEVLTEPVEHGGFAPAADSGTREAERMSNPLPAKTVDGRARERALAAHSGVAGEAVDFIEYRSRGNVLILGPRQQVLDCARQLGTRLQCLLVTHPDEQYAIEECGNGVILAPGRLVHLEGHLGAFTATLEVDGRQYNPAGLLDAAIDCFDMVLDLDTPAHLHQELPPPGYYAPPATELPLVLEALPEQVGEFLKPRYFEYDPDICAHGRSGQPGCRRCLDACPTLAIRSLEDRVDVDPYLCQGGGSCATACPTGAIRYAYPSVSHLLTGVREALHRYSEAGGRNPQVLFFDSEAGQAAMTQFAAELPESVLPFQVEEIGSVGMDSWLAALAYGARRVVLFSTSIVPRSVLAELSRQFNFAGAILDGVGYRRGYLQLVVQNEGRGALRDAVCRELPEPAIAPAGFSAFDNKRTTLRLAIDHLYRHAPSPQAVTVLPDGAPFGAIEVDPERCTLCMSCVGICPAQALYDGGERPALQFIEANCVQCGLCHEGCPEDAVRLLPRIACDHLIARDMRVLHEEEPFCCIVCGKPFATRSVVERMAGRLAGHWMFGDEDALRRIRMCGECRAVDAFKAGVQYGVYEKRNRTM